jgi:hypothetical protein
MTNDGAKELAEKTIKNHPEITDWKGGFIGATVAHIVMGELIEKESRENYELRMLLWITHICDGNDQWSGAPHSGNYMKCNAEHHKIDFAKDDIEVLRKTLIAHATNEHNIRYAQKMVNLKVIQTASGENATHTAESGQKGS